MKSNDLSMDLNIKLFADGANMDDIRRLYENPVIKGFTTNPTLMRQAGITNYVEFAKELLKMIPDKPISLEVFADEFDQMEAQALEISSWGENANVKIPVTNTKGESAASLIKSLSERGVIVNVTAIMSLDQVKRIAEVLSPQTAAIVSVFAGRIADTGRDPIPLMQEAADILNNLPKAELLWASPREVLNVQHAIQANCHIITATPDILRKLASFGKGLDEFSLETVKMFYDDAQSAGYKIVL